MQSRYGLIPDVLSEIFWMCIPDEAVDLEDFGSPTQSPYNVACVCRLWRRVALSSPRLWAKINLSVTKRYRDGGAGRDFSLRSLETTLLRASSSPLSLQMFSNNHNGDILPRLLNMAEDVQTRCERISLMVEGPSSKRIITDSDIRLYDLPLLKYLKLCLRNKSQLVDIDLSNAYQLQTLDILMTDRLYLFSDGSPLRNLTRIQFDLKSDSAIGVTLCMTLLQISPSLEYFQAEVFDPDFSEEELSYPVLRLERLHTLQLYYHTYASNIRHILDHLQTPQLRILATGIRDGELDNTNDFSTNVPLFLQGSSFVDSLEELNLATVILPEIYSSIQLSSNITKLGLSGIWPDTKEETHALISLLNLYHCPQHQSGIYTCVYNSDDIEHRDCLSGLICPQLEEISFDFCDLGGCFNSLVDMILSRWYPPPGIQRALKVVNVKYSHVSGLEDAAELASCVREGLKLSILELD